MVKQVSELDAANAAGAYRLPSQQELRAEADRLYETYVKPLEREHWGEFVAVSSDGKMVRSLSHRDAVRQAAETLGHGNFLFKVGERVVGTLR